MHKLYLIKKIILNFFNCLLYKDLKIMSNEETINYIVDNKCSISRFGDGELKIMTKGGSLIFQDYSNDLRNRLIEVASSNNSNLLTCIPGTVSLKYVSELDDGTNSFWKKNMFLHRGFYRKLFNCQDVIGDALMTRFYLGVKNKENISDYVALLKKMWDGKKLLIVEGYNSKLGIDNDLFSNSAGIRRILCPNKNCFSSYKKILESVVKNFKEEELVITALGPTATVLAYDLCNKGIRCLDLGHIDIEYMWFLKGAKERVEIKGKNTAELTVDESNDYTDREDVIEIIK